MPQIKYTKGLADEMDGHGVALRASGAYVHRSFEQYELETLKKEAANGHQFSSVEHLIVANGRGVLVRWAKLSEDKKFASYLGKIMSLEMLNGTHSTEPEFAKLVRKNPALKIMILSTGIKRVGLLYGSLGQPYATLVDVYEGRLRFTDIEREAEERPNNRHVVCRVLELTEEDDATVLKIRRAIETIAGKRSRGAAKSTSAACG